MTEIHAPHDAAAVPKKDGQQVTSESEEVAGASAERWADLLPLFLPERTDTPSAALLGGLSRSSRRRSNRGFSIYSEFAETVLALNRLGGSGDSDHPVRRGADGGAAGPRPGDIGELKKGQGNRGADGTAEAG